MKPFEFNKENTFIWYPANLNIPLPVNYITSLADTMLNVRNLMKSWVPFLNPNYRDSGAIQQRIKDGRGRGAFSTGSSCKQSAPTF